MLAGIRNLPCIHCRKTALTSSSKDEIFAVAGRRFRLRVDVIKCSACEKIYLSEASQEHMERTIARYLADARNESVEAFKFIRKALDLQTSDVAALVGVPSTTVEQWEAESEPIHRRAWDGLRQMVRDRLSTVRRAWRETLDEGATSIRIDLRQCLS